MFIILIILLYKIFKLKQHNMKTINIQQIEELKIKYEKENEELKKRIDFLEHDC